jgi:L-lactate dehydrogenase complex protein LldG
VGGHAYESVYPGPIGAILTPQLHGMKEGRTLPYASSLCGACYEVCPVAIDIPKVLVHLRSRVVESEPSWKPEKAAMKGLYRAFSSRRAFEAAQRAARLGRPLARGGRISRLPWPLSAWTSTRDLPAPPAETFRDWWRREHGEGVPPGDATPRSEPVGGGAAREREAAGDRGAAREREAARDGGAAGGSGTAGEGSAAGEGGDARTAILHRIRTALADGQPAPEVPRDYRRRDTRERSEIVATFAERAGEYRATVTRTASRDLSATLAELCRGRGAQRVAVPPGLPPEWGPAGVELVPDRPLGAHDLDALDGTLTGAAIAIAETGTIVLDGGPGQGRRALTLVPDYHLCVVREDQIVGLVPEAVAALQGAIGAGRPLTFIAGPSATSDIELNRVEGVHGPRTLDIVVVGH